MSESSSGYPPPGAAVAYSTRPTNVAAIVSLVAGICGFNVLPFVGSVIAVVAGHRARAQIARTGENGGRLATVGLWLGYVGLVLVVAIVVLFIAFITVLRTSSSVPALSPSTAG
ncbi:MAG TPA: DUF4190 domain-containing protein [Cellulomonadaceae bacterium]|nr:DUF4190 domain-containing protein [Cellulomonadaceae bacterium]